MAGAARLMQIFPELKVVYLVRDPRASSWSRKQTFGVHFQNASMQADVVCPRMEQDARQALELAEQFPNQLFIQKYETLAARPVASFSSLLVFLGLPVTPAIRHYILNLTYSEGHPSIKDRYGVVRENALETSRAWRKSIDLEDVALFDAACKDVIRLLGYLPVINEKMLRRLTVPLSVEKKLVH